MLDKNSKKLVVMLTVAVLVTACTGSVIAWANNQTGDSKGQYQFCINTPFGYICVNNGVSYPTGHNLPSLPPFPGIDYDDLGQGQYYVLGISPNLFPNGFRSVFRGAQFQVTISQIDTSRYTTVRLAEWIPGSGWTVYNFNGWYPTGSRFTNFYAGRRGTHYLIGWVDNNHNGFVDFGELTIPWLTVMVQ